MLFYGPFALTESKNIPKIANKVFMENSQTFSHD